MQACTAGGDESRSVVQRYRAVYCRATPYHEHLGDACQRQLCACQYDIRGLRLLDFATGIGAARDELLCVMFQFERGGRVKEVKSFAQAFVLAKFSHTS
jgi:hypothetical protein